MWLIGEKTRTPFLMWKAKWLNETLSEWTIQQFEDFEIVQRIY